jgi:tetratricopeptide (TPR) repeat protein
VHPLLLQHIFMNKLFYVLLALLPACNSTEKGSTPETATPAKEQELQNAIRQYPDSALLVENLVQYFRENGNYSQAISSINTALGKDSTNARFWDIKATLHFENADTLAAIKAFENSVELNPQPDVIISLGVLYAQTANPMALAMADALLQANKAAAEKEAWFITGLYHSSNGDKKKAISFFDKCIAINYSFMEAYREKAIALYDMGQYKDALAVLDKAVTLQNGFDEGYYYKGRCLEKLNRVPEAIEMYQRALMYDPQYIEAKEALAKLGVKS